MNKRTKKDGGGETPSSCHKIAGNWTELSPEIISIIGKHLKTRLEICKFRSICKQWRTSLPLPKNPNFLTPFFPRQIPNPVSLPFNKQQYDNLDLVPITIFLVKPYYSLIHCLPSNGWILSVEERQPGKLRLIYPLSRIPISSFSSNSPEMLNFSEFRVHEVGKGYYFRSDSGSISDCKVVVYSNWGENASINATDFTAIVLYSLGELFGVRLNDGVWEFERINSILWFKDVVCFKGTVYAVSGGGRLYVVDHFKFKVTQAVVDESVCGINSSIQLVESSEELLLVVKDNIKVYKLNEAQHKWEVVQSLGDRILFLGFDYCFLVNTEDLLWPKGEFVISSSSLNSSRSKYLEATDNLGVYVSCLEDVSKKQRKAYFMAFSSMLRPPPSWFPSVMCPPNRDSKVDEDEKVDIQSQPSSFSSEQVSPTLQFDFQTKVLADQPSNFHGESPLEEQIVSDPLLEDHAEHIHGKALEPQTPESNVQTVSKTLQMKPSRNDASSMMKFHGIDVRADYLPILEKVWLKHGDVVNGSSIRSCDTIAMALESLAKVVIILQANSGKTLTDDQARYLGSTLSDLQLMHLKVDWLVPFVEKALALHNSVHLEAVLMEIDRAVVKTKEMEHKFLELIAQVKQGLDRDRKIVSDSLPVFGPTDWDQCLGEGLC